MSKSETIQIRTLPRSEKPKDAEKKGKSTPRWIIYVGTTSAIFLVAVILLPGPKKSAPTGARAVSAVRKTQPASIADSDTVNRYLQDAEIQTAMLKQKRQVENLQFKSSLRELSNGDYMQLPDQHNLGVQMDSDQSSERVFEDLNNDSQPIADTLPSDRINARLATRRWVNQTERAERIQFVSNFIRSAYERGYEVELDQNLVVVGVKRINPKQTVNINQVIDRLARQGY